MLVSAVLDPEALDDSYFDEPLYVEGIVNLVAGIHRNGVLVLDADGVSRGALLQALRKLGSSGGRPRVISGVVDLLKTERRLVQIGRKLIDARSYPDASSLAVALANVAATDALVTSARRMKLVAGGGRRCAEVLTSTEYSMSEIERRRTFYAGGLPVLATVAEVDELLARALRVARSINIYDRQLGRGPSGVSRFRNGVEGLLKVWKRECVLMLSDPEMNIYTGTNPDGSLSENQLYLRRVKKELVDTLASGYGVRIKLHVKDDPSRIFHARFIETPCAVLSIDPGVDYHREPCRVILRVESNVGAHLSEIRALKDICVI